MRATRPSRRTAALAAAVGFALALAGCGSGGGTGSGAAPGASALDKASGVTTVSFWHSMSGKNGEVLNSLVQQFNAKNAGKIEVKPVYQGNYDDTITKFKAAVQQKQTPTLIQVYDIGTRFMIDSKQTVPVQSFVDKDSYDLTSIEPNIRNYYSIDNKLYSMPFNSSMPLLYLNADAFRQAGLDPAKPPRTLAEIADYAKKLTVKDASGQTVRYGFGAAIYGWFLEQLIAQSGTEYCNQGNGRQAKATKVLFDSPQAVAVAQWWAQLVKDGYAVNTGRKTDDAQAAFKSGRVAMHLESTGVLRSYTDAAKFPVAAAPFPKVTAADTGGPIIGGASLWIDGPGHSAAEQRAAWEFVKFLSTPAAQAEWHTGTGYCPVNAKALEEPVDKAWTAKYPQFQTAVDQLHSTQPSVASAGCILGVMPQARKASEDGLEKAILGQATPQQAMTEAAASIQPQIDSYNEAVGG